MGLAFYMSGVVGDDEQLYRRIRESTGQQLCYQVVDGRIVFLHAAFNDPKKRPSVDRAILKLVAAMTIAVSASTAALGQNEREMLAPSGTLRIGAYPGSPLSSIMCPTPA